MRRPMIRVVSGVVVIILLVVGVGLVIVNNEVRSYPRRLRITRRNLTFGRESIRLFAEHTGRFPESLREMNEYSKKGKKYRDKINWRFQPMEAISSDNPYNPSISSEHGVLDGTGGFYYNPKTGILKVNLTKPLKSYWRLYTGERKDEVPAEW